MLPAKLHLADYNDKPVAPSNPDVLCFERRCCQRRPLAGRVTALISDPHPPKDYHHICSLQLRDQSDTGLGGLSHEPIAIGRHITLFFPPHGYDRGYDMVGVIVRCIQKDDQYDIGISLRQRLAA
jgi:hypothetical protein